MATIDTLVGTEDPTKLFELLEELAVGSYGTVYKAKHKPSGDIVALKIITLEEGETFDDLTIEISILKMCNHLNIVKLYGGWKKGEELFIAMELCDGGAGNDLYQVLDRPVPERVICFIMQESLKGLEYLHSKNIIHRDIKASNILLTNAGEVKLTDFGVSAYMQNGQKRRTFIGTPYWMAPEVTTGTYIPYDTKADIWSLGVTCLEMAEMVPPNTHLAPMRAVLEIAKNPPPTLKNAENWSREFRDFIAQCLVKEPERRKNATELLKHVWFSGLTNGHAEVQALIQRIRKAEEEYQAQAGDDEKSGDARNGGANGEDGASDDHEENGLESGSSRPGSVRGEEKPAPVSRERSNAAFLSPDDAGKRPSTEAERKEVRSGSSAALPVARTRGGAEGDVGDSGTVVVRSNDSGALPRRLTETKSSTSRTSQDTGSEAGSNISHSGDTSASTSTSRENYSQNSSRAQRPTLRRTLKRNQAPNMAAEKRMAQQLRELKKLQSEQNNEQETLKGRHRGEREQQLARYDQKAKARDKNFKQTERQVVQDHAKERERVQEKHQGDQKLMQKQHKDEFARRVSTIKERLSKQEKEFSNQLKTKESMSLKALKAKKLDKKLMKEQEQVLKDERSREEQEFQFQLERDEQSQLNHLARKMTEEMAKLQGEHQHLEHQLQVAHAKSEQQNERDYLLLVQQQEVEEIGIEQQQERKHLLETQIQQTEHQNQQQAKVWDQLQKYVVVDHRNRAKAHKDKQKEDQKNWLKAQKQLEKQYKDKKVLKQVQADQKKKREQEIIMQDKQMQDELIQDKADQERDLREEQAEQARILKDLHIRMMKTLQREQAERELKMQDEHFAQQLELQQGHFKQQLKVTTEQSEGRSKLRGACYNQLLVLTQEHIVSEKTLLQTHQAAQAQLWKQHKNVDMGLLQKKHAEQMERLLKDHETRLKVVQDEVDREMATLKAANQDACEHLVESQAQMHKDLVALHAQQQEALRLKLAPALDG